MLLVLRSPARFASSCKSWGFEPIRSRHCELLAAASVRATRLLSLTCFSWQSLGLSQLFLLSYIEVSIVMGVISQKWWLTMEHTIKMNVLGVPLVQETSISFKISYFCETLTWTRHTHTKQRDMLFSLPWTMLSNPIAPTEFALHFLMKNDLKISHAFICIALARRSLDSRQGHPCSADWKRNPENAATTFIYVVVSSLDWFFFGISKGI